MKLVSTLTVLFTLIAIIKGQVVVQTLESNSFGHSQSPTQTLHAPVDFGHSQLPTLAKERAKERAFGSAPYDWSAGEGGFSWKPAVARVVTGLHADHAGTSQEQHKQQQALDDQITDLKHAQGALAYLEERAEHKLKADIDEVDHLIVRRHRLTDRSAENDKDIATLENNIAALRKVSAKLVGAGNSEDEAAVNHEVSELTFAAASLRGKTGEVLELSHEIEATTADGRRMDGQLQRLSNERAAIGRQVRVLKQEGDELQDSFETAHDFEAFEKHGYDGAADQDDPYMREAAAALEQASGWNKDELDAEAMKRREMMTSGLKR